MRLIEASLLHRRFERNRVSRSGSVLGNCFESQGPSAILASMQTPFSSSLHSRRRRNSLPPIVSRWSPGLAALLAIWTMIAVAAPPLFAEPAAPVVPQDAESVQPLAVGERIPSAVIRTRDGADADLAGLVAESGALLVFYRGGW